MPPAPGWREQISAGSRLQGGSGSTPALQKLGTRGPGARHVCGLYGMSTASVQRALKTFLKPQVGHRTDHGKPRVLPESARTT